MRRLQLQYLNDQGNRRYTNLVQGTTNMAVNKKIVLALLHWKVVREWLGI